uniref:Conopeptide n=1 Tax=Macrostomum lignano TaxID=282301 RepID=A0A1I8JPI2_9PLAT
MMKLLLCLLLATVQLLPPIVESGRSEGEARSQCIAACLKDFKARKEDKVSPQLSGKLAQHPHLINSEWRRRRRRRRRRESGKSDTDAEAVANCS